jgi:hypothetical protein
MVVDLRKARRWPACVLAVLFLGYAVGKAVFATQARLGFPGGPPVSSAETAGYFLDPAAAQWFAAASGVLGACLVLVTVSPWSHRLPRTPVLLVLVAVLAAVGYGSGVMIVDGFFGAGVGWRWYHGILGVVVLGLFLETVRSHAVRARADGVRRDDRRDGGPLDRAQSLPEEHQPGRRRDDRVHAHEDAEEVGRHAAQREHVRQERHH